MKNVSILPVNFHCTYSPIFISYFWHLLNQINVFDFVWISLYICVHKLIYNIFLFMFHFCCLNLFVCFAIHANANLVIVSVAVSLSFFRVFALFIWVKEFILWQMGLKSWISSMWVMNVSNECCLGRLKLAVRVSS